MNTIINTDESEEESPMRACLGTGGLIAGLVVSALLVTLLSLGLSGCSTAVSASSAASGRYALLIGIKDYPGTSNDLTYTESDANDMAALLAAKGWTVTQTLLSSNATYSAIKSAIAAFASQSGFSSTSSVLVYYSGHGSISSDESTAYIIPYDGLSYNSSTGTTSSNTSAWITPATLSGWLGSLDCANRLLILDSCYSGGFVDTGTSTDASSQNTTTGRSSTESSLVAAGLSKLSTLLAASASGEGDPDVMTISACGSEEYSYDDATTKHGIFTYYLLASAGSGDSDSDGYVSTSEAFGYTKTKLKAWDSANMSSWSTYGESLLPHISGGTGDFVLFDNN